MTTDEHTPDLVDMLTDAAFERVHAKFPEGAGATKHVLREAALAILAELAEASVDAFVPSGKELIPRYGSIVLMQNLFRERLAAMSVAKEAAREAASVAATTEHAKTLYANDLIEQLAYVAKSAEDASGRWDWLSLREIGIRAVLSRLATMGEGALELPSDDELKRTYCDAAAKAYEFGAAMAERVGRTAIAGLVRARIAHVLAAKDATRAALVAKLGEAIALAGARCAPFVTWGDLPAQQEEQLAALRAYHASLGEEPERGRDG